MADSMSQDNLFEEINSLIGLLEEWKQTVLEIESLSNKLQETITSEEDQPLKSISNQKYLYYQKADKIAQQYIKREEALAKVIQLPRFSVQQKQIKQLRDEIVAVLTQISASESKSEQMMQEKMTQIRSKLNGMYNTRGISNAYNKAPAKPSRFLDKLR